MAKAQVKQIKRILGSESGGINDMFEEMLGMKDADPDIILPKFIEIRLKIGRVYKILWQFATFESIKNDYEFAAEGMSDITKYLTEMKENICFDETKDDSVSNYENLDKETVNQLYKKLKTNKYIKEMIGLCGRLKNYHKYFADLANLDHRFILQEPGATLRLFPFSSLDFKRLWNAANIKEVVKKYVMTILHHLYNALFDLYKIITSPDVDIEKFTTVLMSSIAELKKHPKLSRCKNAFRRIEMSVELLRDNFDKYYRDSVSCENVNLIMENFIGDVSKQGGSTPSLMREFKIIVEYMKEVSQQSGRAKDPNVQRLFKALKTNFSMMDSENANIEEVNELEDPSEDKMASADLLSDKKE
jgi:hypothetical protein